MLSSRGRGGPRVGPLGHEVSTMRKNEARDLGRAARVPIGRGALSLLETVGKTVLAVRPPHWTAAPLRPGEVLGH